MQCYYRHPNFIMLNEPRSTLKLLHISYWSTTRNRVTSLRLFYQ